MTMTIESASGWTWDDAAKTLLRADVKFAELPQEVPYTFTATEWPDDWSELSANPSIAPYQPPPPVPPVFGPISDRQFFQALASPPYGIITTQEALDAVKTGEIPPIMQAVIDTLPADQQFAATMLIAGGTQYVRDNPLVSIFGASQGMNAAAIDAFWRFAEGL